MKKIELIFETTCPNAQGVREMLKSISTELGVQLNVTETNKDDANAPEYARQLSSPTLLVDGEDVVADGSGGGNACRIYRTPDGRMTGIPPRAAVLDALRKSQRKQRWGLLAFIPVVLTALLPVVSCPACWPLYASVLASLGLTFVDYTPYIGPVMIAFAAMAAGGIGYYWNRTRKWLPAVTGLVGIAIIVIGKLTESNTLVIYTGGFIAALAFALGMMPSKKIRQDNCETC